MTVRVRFVYSDDVVSFGIRAYDRPGPLLWSHVDLVTPDGGYLGARSDVCAGVSAGVQVRPVGYAAFAAEEFVDLPATDAQVAAFWDAAHAEIGKPYDAVDLTANFLAGRDWRNPNAWWCSELAEWCTERAEIFMPTADWCQLITPNRYYVRCSVLRKVAH